LAKLLFFAFFFELHYFLKNKTQKESPSYENFPPHVFYKKCWLGGVLIQLFNAKIHQILCFYFYIRNENKIYSYMIRKNNIKNIL